MHFGIFLVFFRFNNEPGIPKVRFLLTCHWHVIGRCWYMGVDAESVEVWSTIAKAEGILQASQVVDLMVDHRLGSLGWLGCVGETNKKHKRGSMHMSIYSMNISSWKLGNNKQLLHDNLCFFYRPAVGPGHLPSLSMVAKVAEGWPCLKLLPWVKSDAGWQPTIWPVE